MIDDVWRVDVYTGYGIVVSVDDVKASYAASRYNADTDEYTSDDDESFEETSDDNNDNNNDVPPPPVPLSDEMKIWMSTKAEGFAMHIIFERFVIITYESERLRNAEYLRLSGPYSIETEELEMHLDISRAGIKFADSDLEFVRIAQAITQIDDDRKLYYPPGFVCLTTTVSLECETITHKSDGQTRTAGLSWARAQEQEGSIPSNLTVIVGTGDKAQQYLLNQAALSFYVPAMDALVDSQKEDITNSNNDADSKSSAVVKLPSISIEAFESVLECVINHGSVPQSPTDEEKRVVDLFGLAENSKDTDGDGAKQQKSNVTFLVGPDETPITAQREVLATANHVLCCMLYSLDQSNPTMPDIIKWPYFDAVAVETVLAALIHRKAPTYVPCHCQQLVLTVLYYLGKTESSVSIEYDELPWRGLRGMSFRFHCSPKNGLYYAVEE